MPTGGSRKIYGNSTASTFAQKWTEQLDREMKFLCCHKMGEQGKINHLRVYSPKHVARFHPSSLCETSSSLSDTSMSLRVTWSSTTTRPWSRAARRGSRAIPGMARLGQSCIPRDSSTYRRRLDSLGRFTFLSSARSTALLGITIFWRGR